MYPHCAAPVSLFLEELFGLGFGIQEELFVFTCDLFGLKKEI